MPLIVHLKTVKIKIVILYIFYIIQKMHSSSSKKGHFLWTIGAFLIHFIWNGKKAKS